MNWPSMVGSMGAEASASIGLMETTMWLLGSICSATAAGFYVQVSHQLGSNDPARARSTLRQGIMSVLVVSALLGLVSLAVSPFLPTWLGGNSHITPTASAYFAIVATALPIFQFSIFGAGMLRSSGNMVVPSVMSVVMMSLDVVFNFFLIFPTRPVELFGTQIMMPGMGLGVVGAAIGTVSAELVAASITMYILCFRSKELSLRIDTGRFLPTWGVVKRALHISLPMGLQQTIMCSAYVMTTIIIAPLGTFAIAANSFGVIVESLCYMPST
jgi:Na+-driven multidrug efflux pump